MSDDSEAVWSYTWAPAFAPDEAAVIRAAVDRLIAETEHAVDACWRADGDPRGAVTRRDAAKAKLLSLLGVGDAAEAGT